MRGRLALLFLAPLAGCAHLSDQAIVDNCRAGAGLTVKACECVRSQMKSRLDGYSYEAMIMLANGQDEEAGARLDGLTEADQLKVATVMMTSYTACADEGVSAAADGSDL